MNAPIGVNGIPMPNGVVYPFNLGGLSTGSFYMGPMPYGLMVSEIGLYLHPTPVSGVHYLSAWLGSEQVVAFGSRPALFTNIPIFTPTGSPKSGPSRGRCELSIPLGRYAMREYRYLTVLLDNSVDEVLTGAIGLALRPWKESEE